MDPLDRLPSPPNPPPPPHIPAANDNNNSDGNAINNTTAAPSPPPNSSGSRPSSPPASPALPSSRSGRLRRNSLRRASASFMSAPISGLWTATGDILLSPANEDNVTQQTLTRTTTTTTMGAAPAIMEETPSGRQAEKTGEGSAVRGDAEGDIIENGRPVSVEQERLITEWRRHFDAEDAKKGDTWWQKTVWGLVQFWKFFKTPKGAFITIWLLLVIAWGGMIFLLLCNASPAMVSKYGPNDNRSARKKWLEVDTQVLNALFCVTGFGLFPWRARDTYLLYLWRVKKDSKNGLDVLAGIHRGWFRADDMGPRLPLKLREANKEQHLKHKKGDLEDGTGSFPDPRPDGPDELLNTDEPLGEKTTNTAAYRYATRTGNSATATRPVWLLDAVVLFNLWNSLWQACLSGCVWGLNRFKRPTWTTTLFIILSFGCGIASGVIIWREGVRVKKVEGKTVPVPLRVSHEDEDSA